MAWQRPAVQRSAFKNCSSTHTHTHTIIRPDKLNDQAHEHVGGPGIRAKKLGGGGADPRDRGFSSHCFPSIPAKFHKLAMWGSVYSA